MGYEMKIQNILDEHGIESFFYNGILRVFSEEDGKEAIKTLANNNITVPDIVVDTWSAEYH